MLPLLLACTEAPTLPMMAWSGGDPIPVESGTVAAAWDGESLWSVRAGALLKDGEEVRPIPFELQDLASFEDQVWVLETDEQGRLWLDDALIPDTAHTWEARIAGGPVVVRHVLGANSQVLYPEEGLVVDTGVRPEQDDLLVAGGLMDRRLLGFAWTDGETTRTWPWELSFDGRPTALEFWPTGHFVLVDDTGLRGDCELPLEGLMPPFTVEVRRSAIAVLAATEDYELVDLEIDVDQTTRQCSANVVERIPLDAPIERVAYTRGGDEAIILVELAW